MSDMKELETGFEMARKERALKGDNCPAPLAEFLNTHDERMKQLQEHAKLALVRLLAEAFSFSNGVLTTIRSIVSEDVRDLHRILR